MSKNVAISECIVIGAGLAGLTMAATLSDSGINVILIDAISFKTLLKDTTDRRTTALSIATKNLFENIGVWDAKKCDATPISDIHVCREGSKSYIHYDHREIGDSPFGYIVGNHALRSELYKKIKQSKNITILEDTKLISLEQDYESVTVHLSNNQTITAKLLIAAHGRHSTCRELAGIECHQWAYSQKTITGIISHEHPHNEVALEYFSPAGPFALLPMSDNRMSFVYCDTKDKIDFYAQDCHQTYLKERLEERCKDFLGHIEFVNKPQAFPLSLMEAQTLFRNRVVLIGESAHVMHPIAGQGFNVSVRDIAVLIQLMKEQKALGLDMGSITVLEQYSRWRKFDITQLLAVTDSLVKLFSTDYLLLNLFQDFGFETVTKINPLRHFFMKDAMGMTGKLPHLLQSNPY